ncbi:MAG: Cell division ABC transporter, permease protein FtsX [Parcubacteria group bacterium GW2011_GWC1_43_12]|nr:MAG: Cell division ABC transporter, permease protein FtsX [Parcubacteria group bacterium GW2011_GWC1_43_12]
MHSFEIWRIWIWNLFRISNFGFNQLMIKTTLTRILKSGWQSFWRNYWLSTATVAVMTLALMVVAGLSIFNVMTQEVVSILEGKVDVSVYFHNDAEEAKIIQVKEELQELDEVKSIEYISKEDALAQFQERHKDDPMILQSLQELDQNPLEASLNVKANFASQYESLANYLSQDRFQGIIDKINYKQNKEIISRLNRMTASIQKTGWGISLVLALLAVLVSFNTVRLTMFNWRDEISVMRLVGAGNWFIRGPFLVEGIIYGIVAGAITLILLFPILYILTPKVSSFLPGINLIEFYQANFLQYSVLIIGVGVIIGGVSSLIAVRRYLKA